MTATARISTCNDGTAGVVVTDVTPRTIVVGLGNPIMTDDSAGLRVAERLKDALADRPEIEVTEDYCGGLRLMERLIGYDRAVVIDARRSGASPGSVCVLEAGGATTRYGDSVHDADLGTALEFGRRAGADLPAPEHVRIVAIEAAEVDTFGERCTPAVAAGIGHAVEAVRSLLDDWR